VKYPPTKSHRIYKYFLVEVAHQISVHAYFDIGWRLPKQPAAFLRGSVGEKRQ
jgi:hypothetical protein